jgi:hypothetical protein
MTFRVVAELGVCTLSHNHLSPVCLTKRFISYEMRYAQRPDLGCLTRSAELATGT